MFASITTPIEMKMVLLGTDAPGQQTRKDTLIGWDDAEDKGGFTYSYMLRSAESFAAGEPEGEFDVALFFVE